jgi:biopolymer transport protein ExbD
MHGRRVRRCRGHLTRNGYLAGRNSATQGFTADLSRDGAEKRHSGATAPAMPLIIDLQNFVLVYVWILWILWMIFMVLQPRIPIGLFVNFNGERTVGVEKSPWTETMAVYVDAKQGFFVNGKHVAREELRSKLQEELLRRGIWVVYFEADGDCLYMDAVYAIDTIQGLGAKLIWITPKTREEWKNRGVS